MTPAGLPSTSSAGPSLPVVPGIGVGEDGAVEVWAQTRAKLLRAATSNVERMTGSGCYMVLREQWRIDDGLEMSSDVRKHFSYAT